MKSEKETIYDYAAELKLLAFKEELECTLSLAAEENWNHLQFLTELLGKESARRRECRHWTSSDREETWSCMEIRERERRILLRLWE